MSSPDRGPAGSQEHLPVRTVRIPRSSSYDVGDGHKKLPSYHSQQRYNDHRGQSYAQPGHHHQYQQTYSNPSHAPQRLRPVVTTDGSFGSGNSFEEERDDFSGRARGQRYSSRGNQGYYHQETSTAESRYPEEGQNMREGPERREQEFHAPPEASYAIANNPAMVPPSPSSKRSIEEMASHDSSEMSTTAGPSFKTPSDNMKRSYFHHSRPEDRKSGANLPPAFMPPKKAKIGKGPSSEKVITPRRASGSQGTYFNRTYSWGSQEGTAFSPPHQLVRKTNSLPSPTPWNDGQMEPSQVYYAGPNGERREREYAASQVTVQDRMHGQSAFRGVHSPHPSSHGQQQTYYPPPNRAGSFTPPNIGGHWRGSHETGWTQTAASPRNPPGISPSWSSPLGHPTHQHREDMPTRTPYQPTESEMRRQVTFESGGEMDGYHRARGYSFERRLAQGYPQYPPSNAQPERSPYAMESPQRRFFNTLPPVMEGEQESDAMRRDGSSVLLLAQPEDRIALSETLCVIRENIEVFVATTSDVEAPAPGRKHPVVVGQLGLRCIHCRHAAKSSDKVKRATCYPSSIKRIYRTVIDMKLDHFHHCQFVPLPLKERLEALKATNTRSTGTTMQYFVRSAKKMGMVDASPGVRLITQPELEVQQKGSVESSTASLESIKEGTPQQSPASSPPAVDEQREPGASASPGSPREARSPESRDQSLSEQSSMELEVEPIDSNEEIPNYTGICSLALPEDKNSLSPLRCFLRQNVCAFSATEEDIAVRTPTTFSVVLGQVGIGCIHCLKLPAKERSNRAVCFPFSIGRIYQSVADIQRFHLTECKMVPENVRTKFVELQSASSKGSKGLATRQYWVSSAKKIGLVDTSQGIRFGRDPAVPSAPAVSLDILAQVASNVTTVNRPLVLPEDKDTIAEFLYVVMEQLQPCRFTEADRNKRRLKDVGCIGVECKHCAGQVESRKFFWSSVNAVESNFVSVHTHMMECRMVPQPLKERLAELKALRKEQTARLKIGSQKAFFARVWDRLHYEEPMENPAEAAAAERAESHPQAIVDSVSDKMAIVSV